MKITIKQIIILHFLLTISITFLICKSSENIAEKAWRKPLSKVSAEEKELIETLYPEVTEDVTERIMGYVFIFVTLLFIADYFIFIKVSRPLQSLTKNIEDMSLGSKNIILEDAMKNSPIFEISELAKSFERTLVSLKLSDKK